MKNLVNKIENLEEQIIKKEKQHQKKFFITEMKKIGIEKLPYAKTALKKFIDPETMDYHYNKHYKGYVEKLNLALDKEKYGDMDLEQIVKTISKFDDTVRNNAGGAYNHALFWKMLSPEPQKPKELVSQRIIKDFGTFNKFKKEFESKAKERFGSGWVWLVVKKNNRLKIMTTPNQDNPLMNDIRDGGYPILGLDLWEHAYYLKYRNRRDDYIENFWNSVNWEFVEKLYKMKLESKIDEGTVMTQLMINESGMISEAGHSHKCSYDEELVFKKLLFPSTTTISKSKLVKDFKYEYVKGWNNILKGLYPENWKEGTQLLKGHLPGLYGSDNERLLLNNITSSYTVFCIVHNDVNLYLKNSNQKPIEYSDNYEQNLKELNRFFSVIEGIKKRMFSSKDSNTLKHIKKTLMRTDCLGKRNEDAAKQIINQNLGENSCVLLSGGGLKSDMNSGIDASLRISGIENTSQIKPYESIEKLDGKIIVRGAAGAKSYTKVSIFVFINTKKRTVQIIKNSNVIIENGVYIFPEESFLMSLKGGDDLKFIDCSEYLS